ncbi:MULTISPECIES: hypothetical protein [Pseudomonas]|uniref:hypothetical protein n=1 Tax=Pseudomonas TaxID=286 RepID=UPI001E63A37F|nr:MULTISPECIES: hypothetical protein [Pseudomonas]
MAEPAATWPGTYWKHTTVNVVANADTYRFCFVEKNRIDAFSRIAARPNAQRAELIATLFGMDQFNEFVGHFNESIDAQLILLGEQQTTLTARRNALAADRMTVENEAASLHENHPTYSPVLFRRVYQTQSPHLTS